MPPRLSAPPLVPVALEGLLRNPDCASPPPIQRIGPLEGVTQACTEERFPAPPGAPVTTWSDSQGEEVGGGWGPGASTPPTSTHVLTLEWAAPGPQATVAWDSGLDWWEDRAGSRWETVCGRSRAPTAPTPVQGLARWTS